ncbi:hypothetical protein DFQ07_2797 [Tenacibaculum caenipelagi]|uniref:Uncharacterized protein n=2 Tax=Tenacibaculum caenipelagi TaxID=1325435 RepID=A0A4R6TB36_9FLAO|nr:hypothetical protein DFQ07_2797 [Tenacibaculum caenipelagi]
MQHFGNLTEAERELFLSVITTKKIQPEKPKKSKKIQLPFELTEEALYQKLKRDHNASVRKRLKRLEKKHKGQLAKANL